EPAVGPEGEVRVAAAQVGDVQWLGQPACGQGGVQRAQERVHLPPLRRVGAHGGEERVVRGEQVGGRAVVAGGRRRRHRRTPVHLRRAGLGDPQLQQPGGALYPPVAERLGEQRVHRRFRVVTGHVAGGEIGRAHV